MEEQLREHRAGPQLRQAMRASQSQPIVQRIQRAVIRLKSSGRYLPHSLLGQAMDAARIRLIVNQCVAHDLTAPVSDGDEVAFLPPMSGG